MTNVEQELRDEIQRLRADQDELRKQVHPSNGDGHGSAPESPAPEKEQAKPEPEVDSRGFIRSHPVGIVLGLLILAGLAIGGYFLLQYLNSYESTDDAQVDGHLNMIGTRIAGTVTAVRVQENQQVQ